MKHLLLIVLMFAVVGVGWHFYGAGFEERVDIGEVRESPFLIGKDAVVAEDQVADGAVELVLVTLSRKGFVVLQDDEGGPGRVIGVSPLLDAGRRRDLSVSTGDTAEEGYVFVSLYQDDGDGVFNFENDIPIRGPSLAPVQKRLLLTAPATEESASVEGASAAQE